MSEIQLRRCAIFSNNQIVADDLRRLMNAVDYFRWGSRMVHPILSSKANIAIVDPTPKKISEQWYITAAKIFSYFTIIIPLIVGIYLLTKRHNFTLKIAGNMLLIADPIQCLQKLQAEKNHLDRLEISIEQWETAICGWHPQTRTPEQQAAFKSCVDFLISHSLVQEGTLFKKAVYERNSPSCIQLLLGRGNIPAQTQEEYLREALQSNHLDIALALCNGDMERTTQLFFHKLQGSDNDVMRQQWMVLFQCNPIELVDRMMAGFVQSFPTPIRRAIVQQLLDPLKYLTMQMLLLVDPIRCLQKLKEQKGNLSCFGINSDQWEESLCFWNPHTRTSEQQAAFKACVDFLISHGMIKEETLFKKTVNSHKSPPLVQLLLERGKISAQIREECLREAVQCNHLDITLLLCNGEMQKAASLFFNKLNRLNESELRQSWTALYRFNPIELVDQMTCPFVQCYPDLTQRENIQRLLAEVRRDCMQWLPHVSQYDRPNDLVYMQIAYQKKDDAALATVDKDRVYGTRCFDWVNQLLAQYRNQRLEPQGAPFRQLPPGQNGGRTMAWFTEQTLLFRNQARQGDAALLRDSSFLYCGTPIAIDRYRWGYTLMDIDLSQSHNCPSLYKGQPLTKIELYRWQHGLQPITSLWSDIEDQFQTVMTTNPAGNPQQFYRELIKLIWLIGNTTPLTRGTGTIVESMWAFVHRYWNLPVPILKKEYPQFDVINISSQLETYQNIWPRYFEPSSLMPALLPTF